MRQSSRSNSSLFGLMLIGATFAMVSNAAGFEDDWRDRDLETPLGFESLSDIERAISGNRDELGRRIEVSGPYGSTLATSLGNSIAVEAGPGATVMINAMQVNTGNQQATTNVDGQTIQQINQSGSAGELSQ